MDQLPDKFVAMLFHLMVIAVHGESGRFDRYQHWFLYTVPANRPTHAVARALGKRLEATAFK